MSGQAALDAEPFVGRAHELRQVVAACEAAQRGRGSLTTISGEAGIGKSRFVDQAAAQARQLGLTVVTARCWLDGGAPPMWPWQPILEAACGTAASVLGGDPGGAATEPDRFARFVAVTDQLSTACERAPICLVIDDVHAADLDALLLLRFVSRSVTTMPLALVLARRPAEDSGAESVRLLEEIEREGVPIPLRRFDVGETAAFLAAHGIADPDPELVLALLRVTGGNPLFLRRIAALGAPVPGHGLPAGLRAAIDQAMLRLSPPARRILAASSVLGRAPSYLDAAAVADEDVTKVFAAMEEATAAGLGTSDESDRFVFSHELVRAACEDGLDAEQRLDAHARAAALLGRDTDDAPADRLARRAHHAVQAASRSTADGHVAVGACRAAAASMLGGFAYERADALLSTATQLHETLHLGPPSAPLLLERAQALLLCGRLTEARLAFDRAATAAREDDDPAVLAEAALGLGGVWVNEHRDPVERARVLALQRDALAGLPPHAGVLRCRLQTRLAAEAVYEGGSIDDITAAVHRARRLGDARALAEALSLCHHAMLTPSHLPDRLVLAGELVTIAAEAGLGVLALMGLCWRAVDLYQLGDPGAGRALEVLRERADALDCRSILYIVEVLDVMRLARAGRLDEATEQATRAYELGTAVGDIDAFGYFSGQTVGIEWIRGRDTELLDAVEAAADSPSLIQAEFGFRATAANIAARAGRFDRARALLDALTADGLENLPVSSTWQTGLAAIVEAAAALGDAALAREAYDLLAPFADLPIMPSVGIICLGSTQRSLGVAASTFGDLDRAAEHLDAATAANQQLGNVPLTAIAKAELALTLARRGRPGDRRSSASLLDQAIDRARRLGMEARAEAWQRAREELRRPAHPTGQNGTLIRRGNGWLVQLGGRQVAVRDLVGMRYLAELLSHPRQEVLALALASPGGMVDAPAPQPLLDRSARAAYEARAKELTEELAVAEANADLARAEKVRDEIDALVDELEGATGLGGRARSFVGPTERARTAVTKAIKRAVDEITAGDPTIGELLRATVVTGTTCSYAPDLHEPVHWVVQPGA